MKYFFWAPFLLVNFVAESQVTKIFFNKEHKITKDSVGARSYMIVEKLNDTAWKATEYQSDNLMLSSGVYKDQKLKVQSGLFTYYGIGWRNDPSNNHYYSYASDVGYYIRGLKTGTWISYGSQGTKAGVTTYLNGKMNGLYQQYSYPGYMFVEGHYVNDKREGDWHVFNKNGQVIITDTYSKGKVIHSGNANPDSVSAVIGPSLNVADVKIENVDKKNGVATIIITGSNGKLENAYPNGDFSALLLNKIDNSVDKSTDSWILIQILVSNTGEVSKISLIKGLDSGFNSLLKDAIPGLCSWHPALQDKKPVDQWIYCTIKVQDSKVTVNYSYNLSTPTKN